MGKASLKVPLVAVGFLLVQASTKSATEARPGTPIRTRDTPAGNSPSGC